MADNTAGFSELLERARQLIERNKQLMRLIYQLAFIATSASPDAEEAEKILKEMIKRGVITEKQYYKALADVERYREYFLDRTVKYVRKPSKEEDRDMY